jgi:ParB-like chromosome segregation protein Spo0J
MSKKAVAAAEIKTEVVAIADLKPHPKNYRAHPPDQLAHIAQSIREHGVYRNIVIARDGTVLAGHGVLEALKQLESTHATVVRLDIGPDDPRAIKVLTGDNEIGRLAEIDDRVLSELLSGLKALESPDGSMT